MRRRMLTQDKGLLVMLLRTHEELQGQGRLKAVHVRTWMRWSGNIVHKTMIA